MTLVIDPNTEEGKIQVETIKWAQDQMNAVVQQFFNNKHRLLKGIKFEFRFKTDSVEQENIKVDIFELAPKDINVFNQGVEEAKESLGLGVKKQTGLVYPGEKKDGK